MLLPEPSPLYDVRAMFSRKTGSQPVFVVAAVNVGDGASSSIVSCVVECVCFCARDFFIFFLFFLARSRC